MQHLLVLCLLLFTTCRAQVTAPPGWTGDPNVCTIDPNPPNPPIPYPKFPPKAEFTLEQVIINHIYNVTLPSQLVLYQHLYDYDANKIIVIKNSNGAIDAEFYYYEILKKSTYILRNFCTVTDILTNNDIDGTSAIQLPNGTWHVRPLNEYLLFSSDNPQRPIRPKYIGQAVVRGVPVEQWDTCILDPSIMKTTRRIWSFAQQNVIMPIGPVGDMAVPVQALISASVMFPNGTVLAEVDEVFNVLSFKPGIMESPDLLVPPKGVFCANIQGGQSQELVSLEDVGFVFPHRFGVRIDASTSRTGQWQTFHLRVQQARDNSRKRIRYDYSPPGSEDFRTVLHDYSDNLTYIMDRRTGSCKIERGVEFKDVSPTRDPVEFFIRHESMFITDPPKKAWQYNGIRSCRGQSIQCSIFTTSIDGFPAHVDRETGMPTGETWTFTNIEHAWSMRSPTAKPPEGVPRRFDYPEHLYLKMYQLGEGGISQPQNVRSEDIEYEFFEMAHDVHANEFDTSRCFRALNLPYLHLGFTLKLSKGKLVDSNHIDRQTLERHVRMQLAEGAGVGWERFNDLELDHDRVDNSVFVLFTLIGPAPAPTTAATAVKAEGDSVETARDRLATAINSGKFSFEMDLIDIANTKITFTAKSDSLKGAKQFLSVHSNGRRIHSEEYTKGSQAGAIIGGLIVGALFGIIIIAIVRVLRKEPMPSVPGMNGGFSIPNPIVKYKQQKANAGGATAGSSEA